MQKKYTVKSLVEASLEIGRVLADHDGVTFRAAGTCMYPGIRPGDVLRIQSCAATDISVGDIAVCRRPKHLFSHRVVAKGFEAGRAYVVTRADRIRDENDGPTYDDDLLGIVMAIERRGKLVPHHPSIHAWPWRGHFALRLKLIEHMLRAHLLWAEVLTHIQENALYRYLARKWLYLACPRILYSVRLPMPALGDAVYRQLPPQDFDVRMDWRGHPVERWTLILQLNGARQPAAWITLARDAAGFWLVDELFVHGRYRGMGLEERLQHQADAILQRDGM